MTTWEGLHTQLAILIWLSAAQLLFMMLLYASRKDK